MQRYSVEGCSGSRSGGGPPLDVLRLRTVTHFSSDMFMPDEHRPVISLAQIAPLLPGSLSFRALGLKSIPTDKAQTLLGGTVHLLRISLFHFIIYFYTI